ncbi:MAG: PAS domain S-box protein, partial [bacterium]|nr:PAS domain S-box protein [bacterium]
MRWSLHRASLLTGVITIGGFLAIAAGSFYGLVGPYFARLDREKLLDHCGRVKEAIETELRELDRFAQDWGAWNDMYEYVVHPNEEFARENLIPVTYAELHINVLAIVGVSGQLVYTGAYDLVKNNRAEFPRRLAKILEEGKLSVRTEYPGRRARGLVALPEGLLMVAVRPILKSTEEGPVRGSLVVGRWLDEEAISNIGARVRLLIAGWRVDREVERLPRGELEAYERLRANKKCGWASEADVGCGVGYLLISDIEGDPVVLVRVVPRRLIYREGKKVIAYCLGVMVVGGAGMWVVYMALLRRLVVSRIQRLSRFARRVAMQGEGQTDETVWAADELGQLAADMNAMVARLREARDSERARRERLARFSAELVEMARLVGEYSEVRREILARTAAALEVTRVSFWRLGSGGRVIECEELCEVSGDGMSRESSLEVAAYPTYFEVLQGVQVIAADDAQHDVRTREFAETYLKPRGITSMMDAPVRLHGEMVGIVCCEHTGPGRVWSLEEQEFLAGVADLLALACETAERRRVEEKLRENEQRLLLAQEFGRIGTWDRDLRSKQEVWSGVTKEIFGVASEAREEGSLLEFVHPHDRGMVEEAIRNCLERGMVYNIEHRIVRPDGVVRWVAERGNVVRDEQGVPVRMLGLIMDITERKEAELALAAEKERLMVTLRSIGDGVITTDMKGRVTLMNKEAERLTGWKQEEVRGRVLGEVLSCLLYTSPSP